MAIGTVGVVLGMKTKVNAFLHKVEEYLHQKVNDAREYESVLESVLESVSESVLESVLESVSESVLASVYTSVHRGILRVMFYVFHNLLRKPAIERPMCLLWPCPACA